MCYSCPALFISSKPFIVIPFPGALAVGFPYKAKNPKIKMKVYSFSDSKYCKAVFFWWAEHQQQAEWGSWATFGLIPSTSHGTVSNVQPKLPLADSGTPWCQCTLAFLHGPLQFLPFGAANLTTKTVFFSFDIFFWHWHKPFPKEPHCWGQALILSWFCKEYWKLGLIYLQHNTWQFMY